MDIVDTCNLLTPSDQLDGSLVIGQNVASEASNEFGPGILLEEPLRNMLSDKDPMFGSASAQFNPLDNDDGLGGLSGALPCQPAASVKRSVGRPRKHPRVVPPETVVAEAPTSSTPPTPGSKPRGRPRKIPTNRQLSSFLIERGLRGSQLKKELGLGGRVHVQNLDPDPWLNPEVVLRRLTVTVGGFRIELLPGPSYDTVDAGQAPGLQEEGVTPTGEMSSVPDATAAIIQDGKAAAQGRAPAVNQIGPVGGEEDAPLGLGPFVNPNDVQAPNAPPAPNTRSDETKVDIKRVSPKQMPLSKGEDVVNPNPNLPMDKIVSNNKADDKDKLKDPAKALEKPKPRLPTVKNKSLVSRRPKSQIKGANPPPSSPTKPPQREDQAAPHAKPLKEKKGVVSLKRPGENSQPEHASKVLKIQTGKPAHPKPKSPGPSGAAAVRKSLSCDGHGDPHDLPKHATAHHSKPERPAPAPAPPGSSSKPPGEDGGPERPRGRKPDKLLQRQKSKTPRTASVEEPALFVPDNAPAAAKKESAEEQPAEGAWDGTNSCGLCKKHHGNMFMVGCGRCDDWFHGDCVGLDLAKVQEMEDEDQMYVCLKCCAEESGAKAEPEAPKQPAAAPEAEAAPEAAGSAPPGRQRQGPPQGLASGGVRPMKKESERRQSTEVKDSTHRMGSHQRHKGSSSAPKKPASVEDIRRSVRDSLRDILLQRLKESDLKVAPERACEVARKTERELFHLNKDTDSKYKSKYRSLMFNLRDAKNNVLFRRVLKGDISPANLSRMSPEELASKELAAWRQRENRHTIEMIEKDQREAAERRPITKITHKGEIEIESEEPAKAAAPSESPSPTRVLDLPAELLPLEQKAEGGAKVEKDTTALHKSHLFDLHCKICTGRMAPPVEEPPTKVVKVATTVARRPSAAAVDKTAKGAATKDDDPPLSTLDQGLRSYEPRLGFTSASKDEGVPFISTLQCMWRGFVNMAAVAKLVTRAFPVSGVLDHLTEDLPDSVQVGGRINPQVVWDYFDKIRATGTKEVCLIRFSPETEEDEISYTLLYAYFSSRKRFGVVSNNLRQVRDMYIIPLGAAEKIPHQLVPFDGPGLESNRPNLLLGLVIRQRPKRDFLPVDVNETAAIVPEAPPPAAPALASRPPEAQAREQGRKMEEEEEEPAAKKYLSYLIPAKKEAEKPAGAPRAEEREQEEAPGAESAEGEAWAEEEGGEPGSESLKPLRFLPGVLLGWGGELPPLPDFGAKPPSSAAGDPGAAKATAKSPRAGRFVIKKREPRPAPAPAASPAGTSDGGVRPAAAQRAPPGLSLREKPTDVSVETYLAGLDSPGPPPNGQVANRKEDPAALPASGAEGTSSPGARALPESPKAPLSILKKSSVYSSPAAGAQENCADVTMTPPPGAQNRPGAGPLAPAVSPPLLHEPAARTAGSGASPGEKTKDPRGRQVAVAAATAAVPGDDVNSGAPLGAPVDGGEVEGRPRSLSEEVSKSPPARQNQNHSDPQALPSPPASKNRPPSLGEDTPPSETFRRPPPSPAAAAATAAAAIKDHRRSEDQYSDPWERPRHQEERDRSRDRDRDRDHHHHHRTADHHGDKKSRHQDRHRERSRHRGHSEERRKERYRGDEHCGRHKERHRHRRDSDHENGRRSSRDSYS